MQCTEQLWRSKIEANHPELIGKQAEVAAAISQPEIVLQDRDYGNRRHHIRRNTAARYTSAVVGYRYSREGVTGHVITAFERRRLRTDDEVLYVSVRR